MALTDEGSGIPATMLVGPTGYGNGGGFGGFGGDGWWIILLLLAFNGGWGGGFGGWGGMGGFGGMYEFPWLLNGQQNINANTNAGFRDAMLNDNVTSIRDGVYALATQLCNSTSGITASITGAQNALAQQLYTNQISDLERSFAAQTANSAGLNALQGQLAQCCCDNRLATANLGALVQSENCADRQALSDGIRDLLAATQNQTQTILTQMCNDKLEAKNDLIAQLRSELLYARGQASQDVQTAAIQAGQRALANEVEQYVLPTPRPAYIVQNPNCCYNPCGTNCGCGVG